MRHQSLAVAVVSGAVTTAPTNWINTVQYPMATDLHSSLLQSSGGLQLLATAFGTVLMRVVAGFGRRAMVIALVISGAAALFVAASTGAVAALFGQLVQGVSGPSAGDLAPILLRVAVLDHRTRDRLTVTLSAGQYFLVTVLVVGLSPLGLILGYRWPFAITGGLCIGLAAWAWTAFRQQPADPQLAQLLEVPLRRNYDLPAQEPAIEYLDERGGWHAALRELAREVRRAGWPFQLTMAASVLGKTSFTAFYAVYVILLTGFGLSGLTLGLTVAGLQLAQFVTVGPLSRWDHLLDRYPSVGRLAPYAAGLAWLTVPAVSSLPRHVPGELGQWLAVGALTAVYAAIDIYSNLTKVVVSVDAMDDPKLSERRRVDRGLLDLLFGLVGSALGAGLAPPLRTHGLVVIATTLVLLAAGLQALRLQVVARVARRRPTRLPWRVLSPIDGRTPARSPILAPDAELDDTATLTLVLAAVFDAFYMGWRYRQGATLLTPTVQRQSTHGQQLALAAAALATVEDEAMEMLGIRPLQPLLLTAPEACSLVLTGDRSPDDGELHALADVLSAFPVLGQVEFALRQAVSATETEVPRSLVQIIGRRQPAVLIGADLALGRFTPHQTLAAAMAAGMTRAAATPLVGLGSTRPQQALVAVSPRDQLEVFHGSPHQLSAWCRRSVLRIPGVHAAGPVLPAVEEGQMSLIVPVVLEQRLDDATETVKECLSRVHVVVPHAHIHIICEGHAVHQA